MMENFEKTKKQLEEAFVYCQKLLASDKYDLSIVDPNMVPRKIGVYLWYSKGDNKIAYVGRAFGKKGIYQRIVKQHLSNSYTKSVFKKQIAEEFGLNLKEGSASYIKNNFVFSFITFEEKDISIASLVEILLINEFLPRYNRAGKYLD